MVVNQAHPKPSRLPCSLGHVIHVSRDTNTIRVSTPQYHHVSGREREREREKGEREREIDRRKERERAIEIHIGSRDHPRAHAPIPLPLYKVPVWLERKEGLAWGGWKNRFLHCVFVANRTIQIFGLSLLYN